MMKCTSNTISYQCSNEQFCDISISIEDCTTKKQYSLVLREDEIAAVATNLSIIHNDGIILKQVDGMEIELKLVVVQSLPRKSIDYSILSSYSQLYHLHSSPLLIGHRGCGVNAVRDLTITLIHSYLIKRSRKIQSRASHRHIIEDYPRSNVIYSFLRITRSSFSMIIYSVMELPSLLSQANTFSIISRFALF